jgi:CheY-like chemotaxis protein
MATPERIENPIAAVKPTVLLVEDVLLVRILIAELLRERGFDVIEAADGEQAVRVLQADSPIRVILSDIYMPNTALDGVGLARWVRSHRPDLKVILGSGVVSTLDPGDAAFHEGPLLRKPYKQEELERRLRAVLGEA